MINFLYVGNYFSLLNVSLTYSCLRLGLGEKVSVIDIETIECNNSFEISIQL
jgi:hypothetical protein